MPNFQKALLSAFSSKAKLAQMVSFQLNENLEAIAGGENLSDLTFNLLTHLESAGRLNTLLSAALNQNPTNPELQTFAKQIRGSLKLAIQPT